MESRPTCTSKININDFESSNSNSYGEPAAKRANTSSGHQPSRNHGSGSADANVTLWQFLLDLLVKQQYSNIICWTNNEGEFKLLDAEQVAKLWGLKKNKNNMNYDKLSRALRYYYDKNIIKKVMGQKFVYRFVSFPEMVKTENRIPFKKKMESIVNESNCSNTASSSTAPSITGFQTLRPYDVKSGLIQQAQLAAAASLAQQHAAQAMFQHQQAAAHSIVEQKYQIPADHHQLYHQDDSSQSHSSANMGSSNEQGSQVLDSKPSPSSLLANHMPQTNDEKRTQTSDPGNPVIQRPSPSVSPVSVCTPAGSPSPAPVFDLPVSGTPTPPPKPTTPVKAREPEIKVKLEIPELDDGDAINHRLKKDKSQSINGSAGVSEIAARRLSKQSKVKPDPLSISNDVVVNASATSPLMTRGILPSLNTPMFLTSPMFGQRTPLIPGIHFWGPSALSPVATLSPRLGGLSAGPAFQFPAFAAVSPATLASFSTFSDNVFSNATSNAGTPNPDKKVSTS